ncbi:hypothetical protein [Muricoccus aerilatus]|uniref:hypothetical protein n=1 Tax=Muricoccus aerilatus TaxID=452982 RepID=UPI0005C19510|nr:hypothetical protein [Roseomonas aerilata]
MPLLVLLPTLAPLLAPIVGRLVASIGGEQAEAALTSVAGAVLGGTDEAHVRAALADPQQVTAVAVRLAEIAAQRGAAADQARLEVMKAELAGMADARRQTVALAAQNSVLSWGAAVVTLILLGLFAAIVLGRLYVDVDIRETVKTLTIAAATYWIGSSRGSAVKDERGPAAGTAPAMVSVTGTGNIEAAARQPMAERSAEEINRALGGRQS